VNKAKTNRKETELLDTIKNNERNDVEKRDKEMKAQQLTYFCIKRNTK